MELRNPSTLESPWNYQSSEILRQRGTWNLGTLDLWKVRTKLHRRTASLRTLDRSRRGNRAVVFSFTSQDAPPWRALGSTVQIRREVLFFERCDHGMMRLCYLGKNAACNKVVEVCWNMIGFLWWREMRLERYSMLMYSEWWCRLKKCNEFWWSLARQVWGILIDEVRLGLIRYDEMWWGIMRYHEGWRGGKKVGLMNFDEAWWVSFNDRVWSGLMWCHEVWGRWGSMLQWGNIMFDEVLLVLMNFDETICQCDRLWWTMYVDEERQQMIMTLDELW